jgi:hypothetical protein
MLHNHHHQSSGVGTISLIVADVSSGLGLTLPEEEETTLDEQYISCPKINFVYISELNANSHIIPICSAIMTIYMVKRICN